MARYRTTNVDKTPKQQKPLDNQLSDNNETTISIANSCSNININTKKVAKKTAPPISPLASRGTIEMTIDARSSNSPNKNASSCNDAELESDQIDHVNRNKNTIDTIDWTPGVMLFNENIDDNDCNKEKFDSFEGKGESFNYQLSMSPNQSNASITPQLHHQHFPIDNINVIDKNKQTINTSSPPTTASAITMTRSITNNIPCNGNEKCEKSTFVDAMNGNSYRKENTNKHSNTNDDDMIINKQINVDKNRNRNRINQMESDHSRRECLALSDFNVENNECTTPINSIQGKNNDKCLTDKTSTTKIGSNCNIVDDPQNDLKNIACNSKNGINIGNDILNDKHLQSDLNLLSMTISSSIKRKFENLNDIVDNNDEPNRKRRRVSTSTSNTKMIDNLEKKSNMQIDSNLLTNMNQCNNVRVQMKNMNVHSIILPV